MNYEIIGNAFCELNEFLQKLTLEGSSPKEVAELANIVAKLDKYLEKYNEV